MIKPAAAGSVLAVVSFLAWRGVDVWPVLLLAGLAGALYGTGAWQRLGSPFRRSGTAIVRTVTFDDIGGQDAAKRELQEALDFLRQPEAAGRMGIRPLKGILLTGPPGTGKTLLAKASAHLTGSAFVAASGSEFVEVYAGVGAGRVRRLFTDARRQAKREHKNGAIIFIDELEVMAGKRGRHQSHLEYDQTLNQLLVEMDGIATSEGIQILVMGATNRADLLDPALLRPGRFDRVVEVGLPDRAGRRAILALHCRNKPLATDVDLDAIARDTFGFSGAHLESVANEAAILAFREGEPHLRQRHLQDAVDKVLLGERIPRRLDADAKRRVAFHEGGHALVGELLTPGSVASVTIAPRGSALGFVRQSPEDDRYLETPDQLRNEIAVCLAGSLAETLGTGSPSTGAANDFEKAWAIARRLVTSGLSPLGVVHEEALSPERLYDTIHAIVAEQRERTERLLAQYGAALQALATRLQEEETLSGETVRTILAMPVADQAG